MMFADTLAAAVIRGMPGFMSVDSSTTSSVGLYGFLNGTPVIRASNILAPNTIICIFKGNGFFNAPLVHSPYMPLFISDTLSTGTNPLRNQRVAAVWAGLKTVIPNFITKIEITT